MKITLARQSSPKQSSLNEVHRSKPCLHKFARSTIEVSNPTRKYKGATCRSCGFTLILPD
jgi:hypothetical protein